jgi:hypothetical protein
MIVNTLAESPDYLQVFDRYRIQFPCPFCNHLFDEPIGRLKNNRETICVCKNRVVFDTEELGSAVAKLAAALHKFWVSVGYVK